MRGPFYHQLLATLPRLASSPPDAKAEYAQKPAVASGLRLLNLQAARCCPGNARLSDVRSVQC